MEKLESLENQIRSLNRQELQSFRQWFLDFDGKDWDAQIENDINSGKLESLAQHALQEHLSGKTLPL